MIVFENVSKIYEPDVVGLQDFTWHVPKGEFVFLVGPSGSGKTTLIKLVLKELEPTEGRILVAGRNLSTLRRSKVPFLRRNIGCVFQDFKLLPNKTVWENVAYALEVVGENRRSIRRKVPEIVNLVGLADKANGNIDPETSIGLMQLLMRINRTGTTVVVATHDRDMVNRMKRRVIQLEGGRMVRDEHRGSYDESPAEVTGAD